MKKDAYYFSHDCNARNDERIMFMRSKYGLSAYAIYFLIIEIMHEQADGKLSVKLLDGLCQQLNVDKTLLNDFYNDAIECGLFVTDGEKYWSNRVLRNKNEFNEKRLQKSVAGKIGSAARWGNNNIAIAEPSQSHSGVITENSKVKESKVKESKAKESKVKVSEREMESLHSVFSDFVFFRKTIGKMMNDASEKFIKERLKELSGDEETQIAILKQSIVNGWANVYALKEPRKKQCAVKSANEEDNIDDGDSWKSSKPLSDADYERGKQLAQEAKRRLEAG